MTSDYVREKKKIFAPKAFENLYCFCYNVNNYQHSSSFTPLIFTKSIEYSTVDESRVLQIKHKR